VVEVGGDVPGMAGLGRLGTADAIQDRFDVVVL
jgi:hypothetical protein